MSRRFALMVVLSSIVLVSALVFGPSSARSASPGAFPAIVVFRNDASLDFGRAFFRSDDRARANPDAWGYLDAGVVGAVQPLEDAHGFRATHVYSHAVRGFAAPLTAEQIQALEQDPAVAYVEADGPVSVAAQTLPWGISRIGADLSSARAGNGSGAVNGVHVYVIDTGIDVTRRDLSVVGHVDFAGGVNADCNGHGTHVAGIVAAKDNTVDVVGAAPGAPLTGVKVLDCTGTGTVSGAIQGVDWVTANAIRPAVANMSLGAAASAALDDAVRQSAASGVFYAIAAGNNGGDACGFSPARASAGTPGIITVGATNTANADPPWSNFGPCVELWAPGVSILSTRLGGGTLTLFGTSMAAPHVAGAAALYLSSHPTATPGAVGTALMSPVNAFVPGTIANDGAPIVLVNERRF